MLIKLHFIPNTQYSLYECFLAISYFDSNISYAFSCKVSTICKSDDCLLIRKKVCEPFFMSYHLILTFRIKISLFTYKISFARGSHQQNYFRLELSRVSLIFFIILPTFLSIFLVPAFINIMFKFLTIIILYLFFIKKKYLNMVFARTSPSDLLPSTSTHTYFSEIKDSVASISPINLLPLFKVMSIYIQLNIELSCNLSFLNLWIVLCIEFATNSSLPS